MGHSAVNYKEKWAVFSSITESFITSLTVLEEHEEWVRKEHGSSTRLPSIEIEDAVFTLTLNKSGDEALKNLMDTGIPEADAKDLISRYGYLHEGEPREESYQSILANLADNPQKPANIPTEKPQKSANSSNTDSVKRLNFFEHSNKFKAKSPQYSAKEVIETFKKSYQLSEFIEKKASQVIEKINLTEHALQVHVDMDSSLVGIRYDKASDIHSIQVVFVLEDFICRDPEELRTLAITDYDWSANLFTIHVNNAALGGK